MAAGQVVPGLTGSSACIGASATAAEYALVAFNGSPSASASFDASAEGVLGPTASSTLIAASSPSALLSLSAAAPVPTYQRSSSFEAGFRLKERQTLSPIIGDARTWARSRANSHVRFDVIPNAVAVGQILKLNANNSSACSSPTFRAGRVAAVTSRAIVVADTANPVGGYTDAEYASLGVTFDTLVDPVDRAAFGDPSDIDGNGKIVIFFTKTVNDLTPASSSSYVGGFFFSRDLFPAQATAEYDACAGSNVGEIFYMMVPDPSRGGAFSKANVSSEVTATLAHEYQHLINSSRKMYVNTNATDFEESWLDEGLAHVAEELLFYRASGLKPRQNLDLSAIRASSATINAFNTYASSNFGRFDSYLAKPSGYSPYAPNDSLETRGAAWAFLRYAADRRGSAEGTVWYSLVNSSSTGFANLRGVFGTDITTQLRNWGTAVLTDDVAGVTTDYQQQSWNFRSLFAALGNSNVFPLSTVTLGSSTRSVNLVRGGNSYLRFAVAAGETATIKWNAASSAVQFSLVRLK